MECSIMCTASQCCPSCEILAGLSTSLAVQCDDIKPGVSSSTRGSPDPDSPQTMTAAALPCTAACVRLVFIFSLDIDLDACNVSILS